MGPADERSGRGEDDQGGGSMERTRRMGAAAWIATAGATALLACSGDGPTGPDGSGFVPDSERGRAAFLAECATCHAGRDGFDLAYFGFPTADIVRRGVAHVDTAAARDIDAYLATLGVQPVPRDRRVFQSGGGVAAAQNESWQAAFGATGWPKDLTVDALRALDLRDIAVPVPFPLWSSEADESDWMPELPLLPELLSASGGALAGALEAYHADRTTDRLLTAIEVFGSVSRPAPDAGVCAGSAGDHARPVACFEARRWMASLAATHLLRAGEEREVPYEVARLWWDVGEAGVTAHFRDDYVSRTTVVAWLYLGSVFAPGGFPGPTSGIVEEAGYMGQFLQSLGLERVAVMVTLRRMVDDGAVHRDRPFHAYWDLNLAATRAPRELMPDVLEWGLAYLLDEQARGVRPEPADVEHLRGIYEGTLMRLDSGDPARDAEIRALVDRMLDGAGAP